MTYTYRWGDEFNSVLVREDEHGNLAWIAPDPDNTSYAEFLASGATAAPYVAPPAPKALTTEEKVNRLLSDYGLTRDELLKAVDSSAS